MTDDGIFQKNRLTDFEKVIWMRAHIKELKEEIKQLKIDSGISQLKIENGKLKAEIDYLENNLNDENILNTVKSLKQSNEALQKNLKLAKKTISELIIKIKKLEG